MLNVETYNLLMSVMGAYFGAMGQVRASLEEEFPTPPPIMQLRGGYAESPGWYMVQAAEFDPEPLTVENLRVRDTYASERIAQALLDLLASEQWLDRRVDGNSSAYHLTAAGRDVIAQMNARYARLTEPLNPMPLADTERLEALLRRIIDASLQSATPPGTWCLAHSRNRAPSDDSIIHLKIIQHFSDFNAFRDDVHMAAFQPQEPLGYVWEAFTFVMDETANSADTLFAQLAYRGYSASEFGDALTSLMKRGWLAQDKAAETYHATDVGKSIRADVERLTDEYFYGPWAELSQGEVDEVHELLRRLQEGLQKIAS